MKHNIAAVGTLTPRIAWVTLRTGSTDLSCLTVGSPAPATTSAPAAAVAVAAVYPADRAGTAGSPIRTRIGQTGASKSYAEAATAAIAATLGRACGTQAAASAAARVEARSISAISPVSAGVAVTSLRPHTPIYALGARAARAARESIADDLSARGDRQRSTGTDFDIPARLRRRRRTVIDDVGDDRIALG